MTPPLQSQTQNLLQSTQISGFANSSTIPQDDDAQALTASKALSILDSPKDVLRKMLNTNFVMSKASSFVSQYHEALRTNARREHPSWCSYRPKHDIFGPGHSQKLRAIGWGSCGKIYHELGTTHILKKAINGNIALADNCRLWNELLMHKRIEEAFEATEHWLTTPRVHIPRLHGYIGKDDTWWTCHKNWFPGDDIPENLLISEHIPPMHLVARHALIDYYCPEGLKAGARLQNSNDDCLVRLYLGKRRDETIRSRPGPKRFFGLRNFSLCLDQMQELELDTHHFACVMAETLAILHWQAQVDAADVEFVLGGAPSLSHAPLPAYQKLQELASDTSTNANTVAQEFGTTHLWLLDFNQCQPMTQDAQGVDQAVKRFLDNDPYYPRPSSSAGSVDDQLWQAFKARYLDFSSQVFRRFAVDDELRSLPLLFIERLEDALRVRQHRRATVKSSDMYSEFEAARGD